MTPEEKLEQIRLRGLERQRKYRERIVEAGGADAWRAKMAAYKRTYRAKKKAEKEASKVA